MEYSSKAQKRGINIKVEVIIGLMHEIALKVLQEFRDSTEKIGIAQPPDLSQMMYTNLLEEDVIKDNMRIFNSMLDFLRDSIDCYFVMCRQKDRKPLDDQTCAELFQYISRARFNAGDLMEEMRILEKAIDEQVGIHGATD